MTRETMIDALRIPFAHHKWTVEEARLYAADMLQSAGTLTPDELAELVRAQAEGRLLLLPVQEGAKVYHLVPNCEKCTIDADECPQGACPTSTVSEGVFTRMMLERWGMLVFATREEAEAALAARKEDPS